MKNTLKKTLGIVLALALTLTAIGCGVAYADSYRGERTHGSVSVEKPDKAETVISNAPAVPTSSKPAIPSVTTPDAKEPISKVKAEALARESLGVADLHLSGIELDDGRYELDFCNGTTEYNVDVHPISGKVLKSEIDYHDECDRCDKDWDDRYDD